MCTSAGGIVKRAVAPNAWPGPVTAENGSEPLRADTPRGAAGRTRRVFTASWQRRAVRGGPGAAVNLGPKLRPPAREPNRARTRDRCFRFRASYSLCPSTDRRRMCAMSSRARMPGPSSARDRCRSRPSCSSLRCPFSVSPRTAPSPLARSGSERAARPAALLIARRAPASGHTDCGRAVQCGCARAHDDDCRVCRKRQPPNRRLRVQSLLKSATAGFHDCVCG